MWEVVAFAALMLVVSLGGVVLRDRLGERRRRRYDTGDPPRLQVRARGAPPLPRRWGWGTIDLAEQPRRFRRWHGLRGAVPLNGLTLLRREVGEAPYHPDPLVVLRLRDAEGRPVELAVREQDAALFERALRTPPPPGGAPRVRRRRVAGWTLVPAAAALLWSAGWGYLAAAGTPVTASVLDNRDDVCHVEWRHDGRHDARVDCYGGERPGDRLRVVALPAPFGGEAADYGNLRWGVPIVTGLLLLPAAGSVLRRSLLRRGPLAVPAATGPALVDVDAPRLDSGALTYSRIAETVTRRAAAEEWDVERPPPWWLRPFRGPFVRLVAGSVPALALGPVMAILVATLLGWTALATAVRFDAARARPATGTVESFDGIVEPLPWDVEVAVDGGPEHVRLLTLPEPSVGDRLAIRYDAATGTARAVDPRADGTARGVLACGGVVAAALAFAGWRAARLGTALRRLRRAARAAGVPRRYAVTLDAFGAPWVLLFDTHGDPAPSLALPFAGLPRDLPPAGAASAHGALADGSAVVLRIDGRLLYPNGPAVVVAEDDVRDLVNGDVVDLEE